MYISLSLSLSLSIYIYRAARATASLSACVACPKQALSYLVCVLKEALT